MAAVRATRRDTRLSLAVAALCLVLLVALIIGRIGAGSPQAASPDSGSAVLTTSARQAQSVPIPSATSSPRRVVVETPGMAPDSPAAPTAEEPTDAPATQEEETLSTPSFPPVGSVRLADARLAILDDGGGQQMAAGSVIIVNEGPYDITDFHLTLQVGGRTYELTPFNGSPDNPTPILARGIEAGEQVEVPVMTNAAYPSDQLVLNRSVTLRASIAGPPGSVSDTFPVP